MNQKKIFELEPIFDSKGDFKHKAKVIKYADGTEMLQSYGTSVCAIRGNIVALDSADYETNTKRHITEFLRQHEVLPEDKTFKDLAIYLNPDFTLKYTA